MPIRGSVKNPGRLMPIRGLTICSEPPCSEFSYAAWSLICAMKYGIATKIIPPIILPMVTVIRL